MRKDLRRQLTEQARLIPLRQLLKDSINTLPLRITNSTQPIPGHSARNRAREIRNDKSHRPTTQSTNQTPKLPRRRRLLVILSHALLAQHLLEDAAKLRLGLRVCVCLAAETEGGPGEASGRCAGYFFFWVVGGLRGEGGARGVVVAPAAGVREGVVGVVYGLELARALRAFGRVDGDAIWVVFQGGSGAGLLGFVHDVVGVVYFL